MGFLLSLRFFDPFAFRLFGFRLWLLHYLQIRFLCFDLHSTLFNELPLFLSRWLRHGHIWLLAALKDHFDVFSFLRLRNTLVPAKLGLALRGLDALLEALGELADEVVEAAELLLLFG